MIQKLELFLLGVYYKLLFFYKEQQKLTEIERIKFHERHKKNIKEY